MEAIVLAGGLGTRLRHILPNIPKVLAPINGVPFLDILLEDLKRKGIRRVVLAVSYLREQIIRYVESKKFPIDISFSIEEQPLGTGGAIKKAACLCESENIFVINGDTFFDVDLANMMKFHTARKAPITVAAKKMYNFNRYGAMTLDGDTVTDIREKMTCAEGYINGGIYCMRQDFILNLTSEKFSLENDVLEKNYSQRNIFAYVSDGYFVDIGVPQDYALANSYFSNLRKAVFFDRDGTLNVDTKYLHRIEDFLWIDGAQDAIKFCNDNGYIVIVITNQSGIARGYYDENAVHKIHKWMNMELAKNGAHLDDIFFCPHHIDGVIEKYKKICDCRKPEAGMLNAAVNKYKINRAQSFFVGDSEIDMECAKNAGIIGIRYTGGNLLKLIEKNIPVASSP